MLIPSWAKEARIAHTLINARSETARTLPAFRSAFQARRCLIPADGFYEWHTAGKKKLPTRFSFRDGRLFAFAGLWERWVSPEGPVVQTCTLLTTAANDVVRPWHERMPVILPPDGYAAWLDPARKAEEVQAWPAEDIQAVPASPRANSPRNEGAELLDAQAT